MKNWRRNRKKSRRRGNEEGEEEEREVEDCLFVTSLLKTRPRTLTKIISKTPCFKRINSNSIMQVGTKVARRVGTASSASQSTQGIETLGFSKECSNQMNHT